ncbi:hypothetical protein [Haloarcula laminariae]|uniref:hypothetical protein n=1 Tax=Haloarcula laminariae TaxID=2961577 RepID=UPI002404BAF1|nr:hypothetical protein [Halomicroarcula sp. FL173]
MSKTIVQHPEKKLEDVRDVWDGNECDGRGRSTAAGRGYNTERLAGAVLDTEGDFFSYTSEDWYDTFASSKDMYTHAECKSCVNRYPSGAYGRFRIWRHHHETLVAKATQSTEQNCYPYFLVVYDIQDDVEREVGKVVAPVSLVDQALDKWRQQTHGTMGTQQVRDISWHLLLKRLGVSEQRLRAESTVDLTQMNRKITIGLFNE